MNVNALTPTAGAPLSFDYESVRRLSAEPGCYVLTNFTGDVIYIGQAVSLRARLEQHLDAGRHRELTIYGRASLVRVLVLESPLMISTHERGWLNQCELADGMLPPLNKIHAPV